MKFFCSCGNEVVPDEWHNGAYRTVVRGGFFGKYVMCYCKNPDHLKDVHPMALDRISGFKVFIDITRKQARKLRNEEIEKEEAREKEAIGRIEE